MGKNRNKVSLSSIFWAYLIVGLTAFGFAILQKLKTLIRDKNWLSEDELEEGLALVQLYPGPIMVNLTTYVGYRLRGISGAVVATIAFITPTTLLMLGLSYLYFFLGKMPWVKPVFTGLEALVVGVLLSVVLDFGKRGVKNAIQAVIAVFAFAVLVLHLNVVLMVLLSLVFGALLIRPEKLQKSRADIAGTVQKDKPVHLEISAADNVPKQVWWKRWSGIAVSLLVLFAGVILSTRLHSKVGKSALSFFKIGSVAFGNGLTILPLIQADVVAKFHWLSLSQFADGIGLSQITPGPFLVISTFIGYKLGGVWAALLLTFAMFAPSFNITLIFTEVFSHVKDLSIVKGALAGVLAAFVGLLAAMLLQLGAIIAPHPVALIFAAAAFVSVRYFKADILLVFAGGLALWIALFAMAVPILG